MNSRLDETIETIYLPTSEGYRFVDSRIVKEIISKYATFSAEPRFLPAGRRSQKGTERYGLDVSQCPYLPSSEATAKGADLGQSAGKEDSVELDSSPTLRNDSGGVA